MPKRLTISVADCGQITGLGRTKIYALIKDHSLDVVKIGRRTLITMASVKALIGRNADTESRLSPSLYSHVGKPIKLIDPSLTKAEGTDAEIGHIIFSRDNTDGEK